MLRVGSFFETDRAPYATYVFGDGNEPIYSVASDANAFGDCSADRLAALSESGETVYVESKQYTLACLALAIRGREYRVFSFEGAEREATPSPVSVISSYMKSEVTDRTFCLSPIFAYWQSFTADTNVACVSYGDGLTSDDKVSVSPIAITCALSLACVVASSGDGSRYTEVRVEKDEEDITVTVRALDPVGKPNGFVRLLLEDVGERCGFDVSMVRDGGVSTVTLDLKRARKASTPLSNDEIDDIHLALSLLTTMQF